MGFNYLHGELSWLAYIIVYALVVLGWTAFAYAIIKLWEKRKK